VNTINRVIAAASLYQKVRKRVFERSRTKSEVNQRRAAFYRQIWEDAAAAVGGSVVELALPLLEIRLGDAFIRVAGNVTSLDDPVTVTVAEDKLLVYQLLSECDLPVPRHEVCASDDLSRAWRFVSTCGTACVVKPAKGSAGGVGITSGIRSRCSLARALVAAGTYCREAIVEEQVEGEVYRLLYFDGELIDAVLRHPPTVHGDGRSTVKQLVEAENERRQRVGIAASQSLITIDGDVAQTLRGAGLTLRSTPPSGVVVRVKNVINDNRREENEPAVDRICASVVESGARAAAAVGARLAGVDVITRDPGVTLRDSGGVVIEVNTTPGYYYHYMRDGEGLPVATIILQRLVAAKQ
jgi:cyanophycin synthetase